VSVLALEIFSLNGRSIGDRNKIREGRPTNKQLNTQIQNLAKEKLPKVQEKQTQNLQSKKKQIILPLKNLF
jgi:hypothetical protein